MANDEPDFIVVGEKVALGPLRRDLAADYARWRNQLEVRRGLGYQGVATPQSQENWVDDNLKRGAKGSHQGSSSRSMTTATPRRSVPPGCSRSITPTGAQGSASRSASAGARASGTEATRLALDYAFHVLQLRNVMLVTLAWNTAGLRAYERAGFRRIGVRRGAVISRG